MNQSANPIRQRLIWGGGFALVSALVLALQNVVISMMLRTTTLLNTWELGGYLEPSFGNSLLILLLRMVIALPLILAIAPLLHPNTLPEIRAFLQPTHQRGIAQVGICSAMLFISSLLVYFALGAVTPGIALILFFGGALLTGVLGATAVLKEPNSFRLWGALFLMFFGIGAIALPNGPLRLSESGLLTALLSGVAFGVYTILIRVCTRKLHPVPFSLLNFAGIFALSLLTVVGLLSIDTLPRTVAIAVAPEQIPNVFLSSLVLGSLTLVAYLTYSYAIRDIGAARGMVFSATAPALTTVLAWLLMGRSLGPAQLFGLFWIGLVTVFLMVELATSRRLQRLHQTQLPQDSKPKPIGPLPMSQSITELAQNRSLQPIALRLEPGDDLRQTLEAIAQQNNIQAGFILSATGSLATVQLRFADAETAIELPGKHEVLSLSGTLSTAGAHLHLMVANSAGDCRGGHVAVGCTVYTTLEVVIGQLAGVRFERVLDGKTGFPELAIVLEGGD